jgi:glutamyl-tRNA reductase
VSVLVVGLSHRTAPVSLLEKASVGTEDLRKTLDELHRQETVSEVLLLSTCNRIEVYADVARFHPAVVDVTGVLARHAGVDVTDLADHLYVHFAEAAAEHMLSVASGLDSMVVGESQILGQLRNAYQLGSEVGSLGRTLHDLTQTALRVGKRVHSDTGIDKAGSSVVSVALDHATEVLGTLGGKRALIIGAGAMGALAGATLRRRGVTDIVVANRSLDHGARLAATLGGRAVGLDVLAAEIAAADVLVSSTGSTGLVVDLSEFAPRTGAAAGRPLAVLDLALPRDISPAVGGMPGITYIDLETLREGGPIVSDTEVAAATSIVTAELSDYLTAQQQLAVAPTVTALRARANQVIETELARLDGRLPALSGDLRAEVADAVRRAVEKVLHAPTVRVKELAATPNGDQYATALRELFGLDPSTPESVVRPQSAEPVVRTSKDVRGR